MSRFTYFLEVYAQKKCFFGSNTVFLGQEMHYYMLCIAYFTRLNWQICNYAQKRRRKKSKYAVGESFHAIFSLAEQLPTSATLPRADFQSQMGTLPSRGPALVTLLTFSFLIKGGQSGTYCTVTVTVIQSKLSAGGSKRDVENTTNCSRPNCILARRSSLGSRPVGRHRT